MLTEEGRSEAAPAIVEIIKEEVFPTTPVHSICSTMAADTALHLGRCFGTEPEFWMNLQTHYDLEVQSDRPAGKLDKELRLLAK